MSAAASLSQGEAPSAAPPPDAPTKSLSSVSGRSSASAAAPTPRSGLSMLLRRPSSKSVIDVESMPTVTSPEHRQTPRRKTATLVMDLAAAAPQPFALSPRATTGGKSASSGAPAPPAPKLQNCAFCNFLVVSSDDHAAKFCTPVCQELFYCSRGAQSASAAAAAQQRR